MSDARESGSAQPKPPSLAALDRQIVDLLNARAAHPQARRDDVADAAKWDTIRRRIARANRGPLTNATLEAIYRELISGTRQAQRPAQVAFLGPLYSYSHLAALRRFGQSAQLVPVQSIASVFEEVRSGNCGYGIVPLANSTDGRIADTLDSFARQPVRISGEVPLPIHHYLLGKGPRQNVKVVCSKPQALSQCRQWLVEHLPQAVLKETASTTEAAELAAADPTVAAIASREAGVHYGLDVLARHIEDRSENVTRFAVIGGELPPPSGRDKTALMFELAHTVGALADAMALFPKFGLNLTWVESFPLRETPNEYLFFVELEGHLEDRAVQQAVEALRNKTTRLEVLGCYPVMNA